MLKTATALIKGNNLDNYFLAAVHCYKIDFAVISANYINKKGKTEAFPFLFINL